MFWRTKLKALVLTEQNINPFKQSKDMVYPANKANKLTKSHANEFQWFNILKCKQKIIEHKTKAFKPRTVEWNMVINRDLIILCNSVWIRTCITFFIRIDGCIDRQPTPRCVDFDKCLPLFKTLPKYQTNHLHTNRCVASHVFSSKISSLYTIFAIPITINSRSSRCLLGIKFKI